MNAFTFLVFTVTSNYFMAHSWWCFNFNANLANVHADVNSDPRGFGVQHPDPQWTPEGGATCTEMGFAEPQSRDLLEVVSHYPLFTAMPTRARLEPMNVPPWT